jgi:predicted MFS family arabinose efflux permease
MTPNDSVAQRLRPLQLAQFLQGVAPWVPVEKIFMTELGFTPALVATMAAAYAAVVPVLEIPSGILADRWSRRGVLMLAGVAGVLSVLVGAVAQSVATYIASAMLLGVFFALQSGTVDSIVYDTLLEERGNAEDYEKQFGRIQLLGSLALTASALVGALLAGLTSARLTYVITLPFAVTGLLVLARFREPTLHRQQERTPIRAHLKLTWRTVSGQPRIATIVVASVVVGASMQLVFEFGPLWLLALGVATVVFGPYTAAMTTTLGTGGVLAAALHLDRRGSAAAVATALVVSALVLVFGTTGWLVIAAQVVLIALFAAMAVHLSRLLHDAVPSSMRTGVASGVSTLSWLTFLPSSLLFGVLSGRAGLTGGGWIAVALALVAGATLVRLAEPVCDPARSCPVSV